MKTETTVSSYHSGLLKNSVKQWTIIVREKILSYAMVYSTKLILHYNTSVAMVMDGIHALSLSIAFVFNLEISYFVLSFLKDM